MRLLTDEDFNHRVLRMKFRSTLCLVIVIAAVITGVVTETHSIAATRRKPARSHYGPPKQGSLLYKFTRQLPEIDKIRISEIYLLRPDEWKPAPKLKSVVLEGDEARKFSAVWRRLNDGPNLGCFSPAYDVAFYSNNTLVFATQICFDRQKLTLPDIDGLEEMPFDAKGPTGRALLRAIQASLGAGSYYQ
jgi:hypothetical protein